MLNYRVLPAFTAVEAEELLARRIYASLHPAPARVGALHPPAGTRGAPAAWSGSEEQQPPPDAEVSNIKSRYASTIAFLVGALGTHPLMLTRCIDGLAWQLLPDAELPAKGVPLPGERCMQSTDLYAPSAASALHAARATCIIDACPRLFLVALPPTR